MNKSFLYDIREDQLIPLADRLPGIDCVNRRGAGPFSDRNGNRRGVDDIDVPFVAHRESQKVADAVISGGWDDN
jgi:hypothetical protein